MVLLCHDGGAECLQRRLEAVYHTTFYSEKLAHLRLEQVKQWVLMEHKRGAIVSA